MATKKQPFTRKQLRSKTDPGSWQRGVGYFEQGNVQACFEDRGIIAAKVVGTRSYRVKLSVEKGNLRGDCTCPMGDEGVFCKHCVATGLTYLAGETDSGKDGATAAGEPPLTLDHVRQYLSQQATDTLVEIIMDQLFENDALREKLLMRTALHGPQGISITAVKQVIDKATDHDFVDYQSSHFVARSIENAIDGLAELLEAGHAAEVVELTDYALECVENVLLHADDSNGSIGSNLNYLGELHHKACVAAPPDPEALARRLFEWQFTSDFDTFSDALEDYADLLGAKGVALYRELAEAEWAKVPSLEPDHPDDDYDGDRYAITHVMESLARIDGDIEALVAIKSRDLTEEYAYLAIAEIYRGARKYNKALEWAERGVEIFPNRAHWGLQDFLVKEYHRRKRHDDALALVWTAFAEYPNLDPYKKLKQSAEKAHKWPEWRERAIALIREQIAEEKKIVNKDPWSRSPLSDNTVLVRILMWEGDADAAWEEAQAGGCSGDLLMELARRREEDHPEDAVPVYQQAVQPIIQRKNNHAYGEAVALIRKIGKLMKRLGKEDEFTEYVQLVSKTHKPKRNFIAMLKKAKLIQG